MSSVEDYNNKRKLDIFKGQCFNNASVVVASWVTSAHELHHAKIAETIFDLANVLYAEGIKRNYPNVVLKPELVK